MCDETALTKTVKTVRKPLYCDTPPKPNSMHPLTHDIVISGAGPAGSVLALMLAAKTDRPERIALVGNISGNSDSKPDSDPTHVPDPRTLALNHGSRVLLDQLGAWPAQAADMHTVHVSQQGRLGRTLIDRRDLEVPRLGSVVTYSGLLATLHDSLHNSGVDVIDHSGSDITFTGRNVTYALPDRQLLANAAVQSDGRQPQGLKRVYNQHAVLATVQASLAQPNVAYERFTRDGPLALLPHPDDTSVYAVVWCCSPEQAGQLHSIDRLAFDRALHQHFGDRLGTLHSVGDRHVFPLSMHAGATLINPHTVAIGNAAQTLHPVAGQGLNLGLRDVAQLSLTLAPWLARPDSDVTPYLQAFTRRRRMDRWLTAGITDVLPRVFTTANPLIEHASGLALLGLDLFPPVRHTLARHLLQGLRI